MRKVIIIFVLLSALIATASAQITIEPDKYELLKEDVFNLSIYVDGTNVASMLVNISFDPTKLDLVDRMSYRGFQVEQFKTTPASVAFAGIGGSVTGKTEVAKLSFKALDFSTTTQLIVVSAAVNGSSVGVSPLMITILEPWQQYDENGDGKIDKNELLDAIIGWLNNQISVEELKNVIMKWLEF